MKKALATFASALLAVGASAQTPEQVLKLEDLANAYASKNYTRQSVHDPSIVVDTLTDAGKTTYYVFGSHVAGAKTTNLYNWSWVGEGESAGTNKSWFGKLSGGTSGTVARCKFSEAYDTNVRTSVKNCDGQLVPFGNFNAHEWQYKGFSVQGNEWAPDVIWNPRMNRWLMYMSVNGDKWGSVIVCLASTNVDGPYVYQGPVVFSGFQGTFAHNGFAAAGDYKHTDLEIAIGEQATLPQRYAVGNSWGSFWPNCIDPCVFFDDDNNMWFSYGSWSGGIFMFLLDPTTGLRDYTKRMPYEVNGSVVATPGSAQQNTTCDPYFGRKIAGGWYNSGEASYIEKIGKYYFLFMSNGGLVANGGYQIRVFRSEKPDGPYVDCHGNSAIYKSAGKNFASDSKFNNGVLLMGGYKWDTMAKAEMAQGHNSATAHADGRAIVVYHTRTNDGTEGHSVRVHQLFLNEDGWIVASPYEVNFEEKVTQKDIDTKEMFKTEDIVGDYQMMRHTYCQNTASKAYQSPVNVTLNADGTVTSANSFFSGTWAITPGTSHISLTLKDITYKGVLSRQVIDYTNIPAVCISALSSSSGTYSNSSSCTKQVMLWGSKADAKAAIKFTLDKIGSVITDGMQTSASISLRGAEKLGTNITWTSADPSVMMEDGTVVSKGKTVLTATIAKDGYSFSKGFEVEVLEQGAVPTYYPEVGGTTPNSAFFKQFSQAYKIQNGQSAYFRFINTTDGAEVWNNWIFCASTAAHGASGYSEYVVMRADPYGWGNYYDETSISHTFPLASGKLDEAAFKKIMQGAKVDMLVTYNGGVVSARTTVTATDGKSYSYKFATKSGITASDVTIFFSVEKAFLATGPLAAKKQILKDANQDDSYYDVMGRQVASPSRRGIYIHNGKKIMVK